MRREGGRAGGREEEGEGLYRNQYALFLFDPSVPAGSVCTLDSRLSSRARFLSLSLSLFLGLRYRTIAPDCESLRDEKERFVFVFFTEAG